MENVPGSSESNLRVNREEGKEERYGEGHGPWWRGRTTDDPQGGSEYRCRRRRRPP